MSIHIIIDGYNLIRQSSSLSILDQQDIQIARDTLIDILAAYKKMKRHSITVVFDGTSAPQFSPNRDQQKGIKIIFSRIGESADEVIKRMARHEREKALVVSSDRDVVDSAAALGAATISSTHFESKLAMAGDTEAVGAGRDEYEGWQPSTKKKGPSKRLSKKQRRNRVKTRKL